MGFVVVETPVAEEEAWTMREFEVNISCFDTKLSAKGVRGDTNVVKNYICEDLPSALITLTFTDNLKYSVLLSSETLGLAAKSL